MQKIQDIQPIRKSILWLRSSLTENQFVIFSSILVGISAGLAAVILKGFAHFIRTQVVEEYLLTLNIKFVYLVLPVLGIAITIFITRKILRGKLNKGTASVLESIAKKSSIIPRMEMYAHIVTSAFTVGFGGSAGLESPIVATGSAFGSNYARVYRLNYRYRTLLIAAGAAGGIAAAFNAPIAGVLFALEVLLIQISISSFVPLLIAAASGAIVSEIILNENVLLFFRSQQPFDYHNVHFYVLLGVLCGFVSVMYSGAFLRIEKNLLVFRSKFKRWFIGGIILILLILCFPSLYGEGYDTIRALAINKPGLLYKDSILQSFVTSAWTVGLMIIGTLLLKSVAVACTLGSGGNGGNFAPSLLVGACLGYVFSFGLVNAGLENIPVHNFTMVAMAGILAGVFHAPLTSIFLIAEITGGYELMIPLMIVSSLSYAVARHFHSGNIEVRNLYSKGVIVSGDKDTSILSKIDVSALIDRGYTTLEENTTVEKAIVLFRNSRQNFFPVVSSQHIFKGMISTEIIRRLVLDSDKNNQVTVAQIMEVPETISTNDTILTVLQKFDETGESVLPVVYRDEYVGILEKTTVLEKYRSILMNEL